MKHNLTHAIITTVQKSLSLFKDGDVINLSALRAQFTNER